MIAIRLEELIPTCKIVKIVTENEIEKDGDREKRHLVMSMILEKSA